MSVARRFLATIVMAVFAWMFAGPSLAVVMGPEAGACSSVHHADGTLCPDGHDGAPCGDECPCLCCRGHAPVSCLTAVAAFVAPRLSPVHALGPPNTAHPSGVHRRVFRPPRV